MQSSQLRASLIAAVVGGALVAAVFLLLDVGKTSTTKTVVQQAEVSGKAGAAEAARGLNVAQI